MLFPSPCYGPKCKRSGAEATAVTRHKKRARYASPLQAPAPARKLRNYRARPPRPPHAYLWAKYSQPRAFVRFYRILRFALRLFNRVRGRSRVLPISLFKYLQLTAVSTGNPFVNSFLCILMLFHCFRMNSSHEDSRKARNTRGSSFDFAFESG